MRTFRFAQILHRHSKPYVAVRKGAGTWDADGVYQSPTDARVTLSGVIQPIKMELLQSEGGQYTMDDRVLYTVSVHEDGEVIEFQGKQYTIESGYPREYVDAQNYMMKRVSTHDPV